MSHPSPCMALQLTFLCSNLNISTFLYSLCVGTQGCPNNLGEPTRSSFACQFEPSQGYPLLLVLSSFWISFCSRNLRVHLTPGISEGLFLTDNQLTTAWGCLDPRNVRGYGPHSVSLAISSSNWHILGILSTSFELIPSWEVKHTVCFLLRGGPVCLEASVWEWKLNFKLYLLWISVCAIVAYLLFCGFFWYHFRVSNLWSILFQEPYLTEASMWKWNWNFWTTSHVILCFGDLTFLVCMYVWIGQLWHPWWII